MLLRPRRALVVLQSVFALSQQRGRSSSRRAADGAHRASQPPVRRVREERHIMKPKTLKELEMLEFELWCIHMANKKAHEVEIEKTRREWVKAYQALAEARKEAGL